MTERIESKRLLRLPQVLRLFPVSRSTFWAGVKTGKYPKPQRLSARCVAWFESDILAMITTMAVA